MSGTWWIGVVTAPRSAALSLNNNIVIHLPPGAGKRPEPELWLMAELL